MARDRFALAVHAMVLLANEPERATSGALAGSANTHATCLRRVLAPLTRAGLVSSSEGRAGGYRLTRPASEITLAEIYNAVSREPLFQPEISAHRKGCPISRALGPMVAEIAGDAEARFTEAMSRCTVADVANQIDLPAHWMI